MDLIQRRRVMLTGAYKYTYHYPGDLTVVKGTCTWLGPTGITLTVNTNAKNARRSFVLEHGTLCYYSTVNERDDFVSTDYFPMPIPPDATSCTVAISPYQQVVGVIVKLNRASGKYTKVTDTGWVNAPLTIQFDSDTDLYLCAAARRNTNNSKYTSATEPVEVTITFSR